MREAGERAVVVVPSSGRMPVARSALARDKCSSIVSRTAQEEHLQPGCAGQRPRPPHLCMRQASLFNFPPPTSGESSKGTKSPLRVIWYKRAIWYKSRGGISWGHTSPRPGRQPGRREQSSGLQVSYSKN